MIAGDAVGVAGGDDLHDEAKDGGSVGAAVHEIAEEDGLSAGGRKEGGGLRRGVWLERVSQLGEESDEFVVAAVNVANDIERTGVKFFVVVKRNALKGDGIGFFRGRKDEDMAKAFALEAAEATAKIGELAMRDVIGELAVGANAIAVVADAFGHVENDGDRKAVVLPGQFDEGLAVFGLDVGSVGDGEAPGSETLGGYEMEDFESGVGGGEVVFIVGDKSTAIVGRNDLGGKKVFARESAFAGAGSADKHDEGQIGKGEFFSHASERAFAPRKTAICVGGPSKASSSPTGRNATL